MSLRLRLLIVASLAIVALATAVVMVMQMIADRESAGFVEAGQANDAALAALVSAARPGASREELKRVASMVFAPTTDMHGGYCWRDGSFIEVASHHASRPSGPPRGRPPGPPPGGPSGGPPGNDRGPPPGPPPDDDRGPPPGASSDAALPNPPPDISKGLSELCRGGVPGARNLIGPAETTVLQASVIDEHLMAFAMKRVRERPMQHQWPLSLGVIALATMLVLGLNLHGLWTLRRGARVLATALETLELDPRREIATPATPELAELAVGVTRLARRLADAQQRKLELERDTAHQRRMSSLGSLVAGISHEVRNPLTGMKLVLDGIKRREVDPRTQRDVETALGEIARLDKLVAATLGVARDTRITLAELDLAVLVDQRIAAAAPARGITIVRRGEATRVVDRDAAVRILDNLLRNAIDASPDDAQIDVVVAARSIDVIDRGPGVADAQVATLFEPFVTSKHDGTGLGLWMSLALAEARGGTVRYGRADGMTHFTFELP